MLCHRAKVHGFANFTKESVSHSQTLKNNCHHLRLLESDTPLEVTVPENKGCVFTGLPLCPACRFFAQVFGAIPDSSYPKAARGGWLQEPGECLGKSITSVHPAHTWLFHTHRRLLKTEANSQPGGQCREDDARAWQEANPRGSTWQMSPERDAVLQRHSRPVCY